MSDRTLPRAPAPLMLSRLLGNLAEAVAAAETICGGVEGIVIDRLQSCGDIARHGVAGSALREAARVELQNLDRLLQMLTDFRTLLSHLGTLDLDVAIERDACARHLIMEELRRCILSGTPPTVAADAPPIDHSDVTFF